MLNTVAISRKELVNKQILFSQAAGYYPPPCDYSLYTAAINEDETISAAVSFIVDTALSKIGDYYHADKAIQDYVNSELTFLQGSINEAFKYLFLGVFYGFAVLEIVTDENGHLLKLVPVAQETLAFRLSEEPGPEFGSIEQVIQYPLSILEARLPAKKCIIFVNTGGGFSPYGVGRLASVLDLSKQKKDLLKMLVKTFERYGAPIAVLKIQNPREEVKLENGSFVPKIDAIQKQLQNMENLAGWVCGDEDTAEFVFPPDVGRSFSEQVKLLNKLIMRGLMTPSLLLDSGDVGSYSLGNTQLELYLKYIDSLIASAADCVIDQLIRPMILSVFGSDITDFGTFAIKPTNADLEAAARLYIPLITAGVLDMDSTDRDLLREKFDLEV
jgi:hypothetical protein